MSFARFLVTKPGNELQLKKMIEKELKKIYNLVRASNAKIFNSVSDLYCF